jgi:hypothetical protein
VRLLGRRALLAGLLATGALSGCAGGSAPVPPARGLLARPVRDEWPAAFWKAPPAAQRAYRYAVDHRAELQYVPCYCGCGDIDHTSNWDCFVDELRPDGTVLLSDHGFG